MFSVTIKWEIQSALSILKSLLYSLFHDNIVDKYEEGHFRPLSGGTHKRAASCQTLQTAGFLP